MLAAFPLSAQQRGPAGKPSPEAFAAAREVLVATGTEKQFEVVIPMMLQQSRMLILQQNPRIQKELDEGLAMLAGKFKTRQGELIGQLAELYARTFPVDDMKAMTAFFRTPAGTRFVAAMPKLMQDSAAIGRSWGEKLGREVDADLRQEMKRRGINL
jgi:hypothetical protein